MNCDKLLSTLLSQTERSFKNRHLWEQVKFLDKTLDQWENLRKKSPNQYHRWSKKFWEMVDWFCAELQDDVEIYKAKLLSSKSSRQPPNYARFLSRLNNIDEEFIHKLMVKYPTAFTIVDQEWASWVQIVV